MGGTSTAESASSRKGRCNKWTQGHFTREAAGGNVLSDAQRRIRAQRREQWLREDREKREASGDWTLIATTREPPYVTTSETSRAAAKRLPPLRVETVRNLVYDALCDAEDQGLTDLELEALLNLSGSSIRPRRRELEVAGLIWDSGQTRVTPSGRAAVVWVAKRLKVETICHPAFTGEDL